MKRIIVALLVALLIVPSFISANRHVGEKKQATLNNSYNLYKRTIIVFGRAGIKDTFTTPPDCKRLGVSAKVGPYFTGGAGILIGSDGWPSQVGGHTIWGTGWYIFGNFVWPDLRVFYDRWFTPGLQYVEIGATGFGVVTFWVNGSS